MADEDGATTDVRSPSHRHLDSSDGVESISDLPDVVLQTILSSLPTKFAIRTSILSKRWRYVWCDTPCLNFDSCGGYPEVDWINETLARYKARKMMNFHLCLDYDKNSPYIETWIEFVMSRNVENMTLDLGSTPYPNYTIPDSFYINSSLKQLTLCLASNDKMIIPTRSVSWTSLKNLILRYCNLTDGSTIPKILSGCPVLESLTLHMCRCHNLNVLDLSKSLRLSRLEITIHRCVLGGQMHIVAPHIHYLSLSVPPYWPCHLVDVSSLTEARLDIGFFSNEAFHAGFFQPIFQNIVAKLNNVEKLTFGENFLKILSIAELCCIPLPMFECQTMTFETMITQFVLFGTIKLLQNSHELKKLTLHIKDGNIIPDEFIGYYMYSKTSKSYQSWATDARFFKNIVRKNLESNHMALFMNLFLKTSTKTLEKMVVRLEEGYLEERGFEELLEMVPMLSRYNNNVSIVLSSTKSEQIDNFSWYLVK